MTLSVDEERWMRPTTRPQSALRSPLNHILGTEASVRVLRVLFLSDIPIGVSELARQAALQPSGVARVCTRLEDLGVIEAVGRGARNRQYRRAPRFPFGAILATLFAQERSREEQVLSDLRSAVQGDSFIKAAWIEGTVALGVDSPGDAIEVGALTEPQNVGQVRASVWGRLLSVQRARDVVLDLHVTTEADLKTSDDKQRKRLEQVLPLLGPPPLDLLQSVAPSPRSRGGVPRRTHGDLDARALAIARAVAQRIRRDPSLVEQAVRYMDRRLPSASPGERLELEEWQGILSTMSVARLCRFLVQDDARATRLRQSLPFVTALSPEERRPIFAAAGVRP
jgi:DNA-binding MarR family transcriptional regulator